MKIEYLNLEQAFVETITYKYFYKRCNASSQWGANIRNRYREGKLSSEKMREVVIRSGYFYRNPEQFIKKQIDEVMDYV